MRAYYAAAESGCVDHFANALGPDRVDHGPVGIEPDERVGGAQDAAGWVSEQECDKNNLTITLDPMIAEDDTVMVLGTWCGTDADSGEAASRSAGMIRIEYGQGPTGLPDCHQEITEDELASVTGEATPVL